MEKTIKLLGLNRSVSDQLSTDGGCLELVNWRYRYGAWRPVGPKVHHKNLPQGTYTRIWLHNIENGIIPGQPNWIGYLKATGTISLINPDTGIPTLLGSVSQNSDIRVVFLKRTMIVLSDQGILTFLWTTDNKYTSIGSLPVPEVTLNVKYDNNRTVTSTASDLADAVVGNIYTALDTENKLDGACFGSLVYLAAYRLFDGSYILHSLPRYLQISNTGSLISAVPPDNLMPPRAYTTFVMSHLEAKIKNTFEGYDLESSRDLISSVCVFATSMTPLHRIDVTTFKQEQLEAFPVGLIEHPFSEFFPMNDDFKEMSKSESFYLIHEFDLGKMIDGTGFDNQDVDMKGYYKDYATKATLSTDQSSHHSMSARCALVNNDRLYLGNIKTTFGKPYFLWPVIGLGNNLMIEARASVWLKTSLGQVRSDHMIQVPLYGAAVPEHLITDTVFVTTVDGNIDWGPYYAHYAMVAAKPDYVPNSYVITPVTMNSEYHAEWKEYGTPGVGSYHLPPITGYNDARAYKIQVDVLRDDQWYNLLTHELTANPGMNYAFHHSDVFDRDETNVLANYPGQELLQEDLAVSTLTGQASATPYDTNRVQVSEIQNPLVFPAKNSYQVGMGDVICIASGSTPLSQGQFGQFPIMVMTTQGMWALEVGTGEVLHPTIVPMNAEVVNNPDNVISLGSGNILFTTNRGLYIMQGREPQRISEPVEGYPELSLLNDEDFQGAIHEARFIELLSAVARTDFLTYITGSQLGYHHENREVIITNPAYGYSYVLSVEKDHPHLWTSVSKSYTLLINAYPHLYGLDATDCKNISIEEPAFYMDCMFATKPLSLDAREVYKKIERLVLRSELSTDAIHVAGLYLFASDDLETWQVITGIQLSGTKLKDLLIQRSHGSAKHWIVVFAGRINQNSHISYIDVEATLRWINKKR